jgi:hypothetical protein
MEFLEQCFCLAPILALDLGTQSFSEKSLIYPWMMGPHVSLSFFPPLHPLNDGPVSAFLHRLQDCRCHSSEAAPMLHLRGRRRTGRPHPRRSDGRPPTRHRQPTRPRRAAWWPGAPTGTRCSGGDNYVELLPSAMSSSFLLLHRIHNKIDLLGAARPLPTVATSMRSSLVARCLVRQSWSRAVKRGIEQSQIGPNSLHIANHNIYMSCISSLGKAWIWYFESPSILDTSP